MPTIDRRPLSPGGKPGRDPWRVRAVRPWAINAAIIKAVAGAVIVATPVWLGGCALMEEWPPEAAAATNAPTAEPAPAPGRIGPGPIALAPSLTGAPVPPPVTAPPRPLPPPVAPAAVAIPAPPPVPAVAVAMPVPPAPSAPVDTPTFAPISCPPGAIAMWSEPDAAGTSVPICRRFPPSR